MTRRRVLVGACLALLAACGRSDSPVKADPDTTSPLPASALRLPRAGGAARAYDLPGLTELEWKPRDKLPAVQSVVGVGSEQRLVFVQDGKRNVVALELATGAVRGYLTGVRTAALGPDGSVFAVDTGGSVVRVARRSPVRYRSRLAGRSGRLAGTLDGRLLAFGPNGGVSILTQSDSMRTLATPAGPVASTVWGDLIAVGTDTGVVVIDPSERRATETVAVTGATALAFSPSGHRLFVAESADRIAEVDRFGLGVVRRIVLPGTARAIRTDFYGRWLLVRPVTGDSAWVVDLETGRHAGTFATAWSDDLPAVAGARTALLRRGDDVVALDLGVGGLPESGRVTDGADDLWVGVAWSPLRRAQAVVPARPVEGDAPATPDAAGAPDSATAGGERLFLQVSSSRNPDWARELTAKLRGVGLPAATLDPEREGEAYRVVVGPYGSRTAADEAGRKLGMPYFVITASSDSAQ